MKTPLLSLLFAVIATSSIVNAQVNITMNTISVPCCNDFSDSIDYNMDGVYDFKILSYYGMDNSNFGCEGIGNVKVASPMNFGQAGSNFVTSGALTGTTLGCSGWYNYWVPGTGTVKYIVFRDVVSPGDTIFGWAEVHFNGAQNSCSDTMVTGTVAYSTVSNMHLNAGQTSVAGLETNPAMAESLFNVSVSENEISLTNEAASPLSIQVFNAMGQLVAEIANLSEGQSKSISKTLMPDGVYFLTGTTSHVNQTRKLYVR